MDSITESCIIQQTEIINIPLWFLPEDPVHVNHQAWKQLHTKERWLAKMKIKSITAKRQKSPNSERRKVELHCTSIRFDTTLWAGALPAWLVHGEHTKKKSGAWELTNGMWQTRFCVLGVTDEWKNSLSSLQDSNQGLLHKWEMGGKKETVCMHTRSKQQHKRDTMLKKITDSERSWDRPGGPSSVRRNHAIK